MTANLLIVDDEEDVHTLLAESLRRRGYETAAVSSAAACLDYLRTHAVDVVVTDIQMPGMDGISLCNELTIRHPELCAIVLTGVGNLDKAIGAIRAGAYDFITKPVKVDALEIAVKRALDHLEVAREVKRLRHDINAKSSIAGFEGSSPAFQQTLELTRRVAASEATVLITGESGTGKELVAKALHELSARKTGPFVGVNCAAVPAPLLESELFGHVRGAFTDAKRSRAGLFVQASGGTIFLDEIGEMPLEMQAKLLRVLQERMVRPVGADEAIPFDCRVITATNRDLEEEVAEKRFREDLYYRINVVSIPVPPLRDRGGDILQLARFFVARIAARSGKNVRDISATAAKKLSDYDWPGNVRELENSIERAVALAKTAEIEVTDLPAKIVQHEPTKLVIATDTPDELITLQELERRYVRRVLESVKGNKTHAARILGIDRRSLYRRLEDHTAQQTTGG